MSKPDQSELSKPPGERDILRTFEALRADEFLPAGGPVHVAPAYQVRPVTLEDLRLLYRLDSSWYADLNAQLNGQGKPPPIPFGHPDNCEAVFLLAFPFHETEKGLHIGREHFRNLAVTCCELIPGPTLRELVDAAVQQINVASKLMLVHLEKYARANQPAKGIRGFWGRRAR